MNKQSKSPEKHSIKIRKPNFELEKDLAHDWYDGSAFKTAFENAFSLLFPLGEQSFIESVKYFQKEIKDPKLLDEMSSFYAQESVHRKEHQKYNDLVCKLRDYDMELLNKPQIKRYEWAKTALSPERRLAGTVAAEHLTAILADDLLRNKDHFTNSGTHVAKLWYWHALEETEHKAVAFDVYAAVCGSLKIRRRALLFVTLLYYERCFKINCLDNLSKMVKLWKIRTWVDAVNFLFIKPGILRRAFIPWLQFLRKDFHPWKKDNRDVISEWENSIPMKN